MVENKGWCIFLKKSNNKKKKVIIKGFTLVELLAVIVILAIILVIAVPNIIKVITSAKNNIYVKNEDMLKNAVRNYVASNPDKAPISTVETTRILITELKTNNIISTIKDPKATGTECDGYVEIKMISTGKYEYTPYIKCGTNYQSTGYITEFQKIYGGSDFYNFNALDITSDGYIAAGAVTVHPYAGRDGLLVKYNNAGNVIWSKNLTNAGNNAESGFKKVKTISDGYITVGSFGILPTIIKYDSNGNVIWNKSYGELYTNYGKYSSVVVVNDGYIAVGDIDGHAILVKYDLNGNVVWEKSNMAAQYYSEINAISNGYIVAGNVNNVSGCLIKYDLSGNIIWTKQYNEPSGGWMHVISMTTISDGYILVGVSVGAGDSYASSVKYDLSGNLLWTKAFTGSSSEAFLDVTAVSDGYIAVGYSYSNNGDLLGLNTGGSDAIIVKYNNNGNVIWKKNYLNGSDYDQYLAIKATSSGYIAAGQSWSTTDAMSGTNNGEDNAIIVSQFNQ